MIRKFFQMIKYERPQYALVAISRILLEQVFGRVSTRLLGWQGGYVGRGSRVMGSRSICVGKRAHVNRYAWIEAVHAFRGQTFAPRVQIGRGFSAADRLHISCVGRIEIGDDCLFGSGVYISDHNHGVYNGADQSSPLQAPVDRELRFTGSISIGSNVWLGDNVIIVGPVSIGNGVIIGANSIVKQDVPANVIAAGAPLRLLKQFNFENGTWERYES
jgi:acetyltransferase-like isoleucine patch superfamily enzyme